jgi:MFS family permease
MTTMQTKSKNVLVLASCQALNVTGNVTLISLNGLAGHMLADNKALATLPVTSWVLGSALATMPVSLLMHRVGRARGFMLGAVIGMLGAVLCASSIVMHEFWLLCAGNFVCGAYNAGAGYYRFAAADSAAADGKERAISLVLTGGLIGGVLGPEASKITKDFFATPFLGSYASLLVLQALVLVLVQRLQIPPLTKAEQAEGGRPLGELARQPVYMVAVLAGSVAYAVMNLLMTATPLAMQSCHHSYSDSAFVIEWHVIGMYAPAFFTGSLIKRFGVLEIMLTGIALNLACVGIALSGVDVPHFWTALVLLGIGWNFLFVGGTTLLTEAYKPAERAKAQGFNDVVMFASMGVSSASAGLLVTGAGWQMVNYASLPFLAMVALAIVALRVSRRRAADEVPQVGASA